MNDDLAYFLILPNTNPATCLLFSDNARNSSWVIHRPKSRTVAIHAMRLRNVRRGALESPT